VPSVRRVLLNDCEVDEGRLGPKYDLRQGSGAVRPAPGPVRKQSDHGYARAFREPGKSSNTAETTSEF
jgi:hypothetical protein